MSVKEIRPRVLKGLEDIAEVTLVPRQEQDVDQVLCDRNLLSICMNSH